MKKRLTALLLFCALLFGMAEGLTGCSSGESQAGEQQPGQPGQENLSAQTEYMTRGAWITLLGQTFGLDEFSGESDYFTDVDSQSPFYCYAQACCEWEILPEGGSLRPEDWATRGFVAETAVLAAGLDASAGQGETDAERQLALAVSSGIVASGSAGDRMTAAEGQAAAAAAQKLYLNREIEPYEHISYWPEVVDLTAQSDVRLEGDTVTMPAELAAELSPGSVFVVPPVGSDPYGTARKVVSITLEDGAAVLVTEEPELDELFEELDFAFAGAPALEDIKPSDAGIEIIPYVASPMDDAQGNTPAATGLAAQSGLTADFLGAQAVPTGTDKLSFSIKVNLTKGTLTPSVGYTDAFEGDFEKQLENFLGRSIPEDAGQIFKRTHSIAEWDSEGNLVTDTVSKYESGYEIVGTLSLKDMYVSSETKLKKTFGIPTGIQEFSTELHYEVSGSLSIKGKLEGEKEIFTTVIAGPAGIWFDVKGYLCFELNGEITLKVTVTHTTNVTYKDGNFRKTSQNDIEPSMEIQASFWVGGKGEVTLKVLGIEIVDASVKIGAGVEASVQAHSRLADDEIPETLWMLCFDLKAYAPTVTVSVGTKPSTLANKFQLKASWDIVGQKGTLTSPTWQICHYEISKDSSGNVPACTWDDYVASYKPPEEDESEGDGEEDSGAEPSEAEPSEAGNTFYGLSIQDFYISLHVGGSQEIVMTALPEGVSRGDLAFSSSDIGIARVSSSGVITAVAPGTTQVSVTAPDGSMQVCTVSVSEAEAQNTLHTLPNRAA